jgi:23S rRNA A2030 N6-methylase RlmJ
VRNLLQTAAGVTSNNYPENMGAMFIVNAPWTFTAIWSIVKNFLDERTTKKIQIIGSDYQKKLLEVIDAAQLP